MLGMPKSKSVNEYGSGRKNRSEMKQHKNKNYYLDMRPKLMKDFDKMLKLTRKVLKQFEGEKMKLRG